MVYAARHRVRIYLVYAEYRVMLVDPIYNCSCLLMTTDICCGLLYNITVLASMLLNNE
jgi:hypothetical protein